MQIHEDPDPDMDPDIDLDPDPDLGLQQGLTEIQGGDHEGMVDILRDI
jgi:hypothetical protein